MREFIDYSHDIMDDYLDIADGAERDETKLIAKLHELIKKDPEFYDPFTWLAIHYQDHGDSTTSRRLMNEAYTRAMRRIIDDMGRWPDLLRDSHLENRHIIRALLNQAIMHWIDKKAGLALDILRNLVRTDPGVSNIICCFILAIRLGLTHDAFEARFGYKEGYSAAITDWFAQEHVKFPEEWWDSIYEE